MLHRIKNSQTFWVIILVLSSGFFLFVLLASLYVDTQNQSDTALAIRNWVSGSYFSPLFKEFGSFAANDTIVGVFLSFAAAMISGAIIYVFKIPGMRRIAIVTLAFGYCQNFLSRLIRYCYQTQSHFRILLIMPSYGLIENPDDYWDIFKAFLKNKGFVLEETRADERFARHSFLVSRKNSPMPIPLYVDIPTTLRSLSKIIELEANTPVGQLQNLKWARHRFKKLVADFVIAIREQVPDESFGNVRFIICETPGDFADKISAEVDALEAELLEYARICGLYSIY